MKARKPKVKKDTESLPVIFRVECESGWWHDRFTFETGNHMRTFFKKYVQRIKRLHPDFCAAFAMANFPRSQKFAPLILLKSKKRGAK